MYRNGVWQAEDLDEQNVEKGDTLTHTSILLQTGLITVFLVIPGG